MDRKEVLEFFNKRPRNCLLCTANKNGDVNVAAYGSPQMIDENTVAFAARDRRSYQYLMENPKAAIIVVDPGEIKHDSKAVRVYLELIAVETEGELLNQFKEAVASRAGQEAADALQAAMRFEITGVRPLIDTAA
ncbi:MAG: pyridoxamine 5'-phosphate oxidase family protein [Deltaproteobacteria bacterium]|nr:pyridoxamine 5'-phosphate oxidase family protein [Deltaproteobacteria bacterium]